MFTHTHIQVKLEMILVGKHNIKEDSGSGMGWTGWVLRSLSTVRFYDSPSLGFVFPKFFLRLIPTFKFQ